MEYIPRILFTVPDTTICTDAIKAGQHVLLLGPRGCGKTSLAQAVAEHLGRQLITVPCHVGASSESLIGQWVPRPDGQGFQWMDGLITSAVRHGHLVLLDEVNVLKAEVAFCIHGLLDHRRQLILTDKPGPDGSAEIVHAHPAFGLIAAGNLGYAGTRELNPAFRDRFAVQIAVCYHADIDIAVLEQSPAGQVLTEQERTPVRAFIRKLRSEDRQEAIPEVSTRAIIDFAWNLASHGFPVARALFLGRYDDEGDRSALRVLLREFWANDGTPRSTGGAA